MGADHDGGRAAGAKGAATEETRKGLRLRILPGTGCHRAGPPSKSGARAGGGRSDDFTQSNCGGTEAELATSATTCLHPQPPSRAYICVEEPKTFPPTNATYAIAKLSAESGKRATLKLLDLDQPPTAIFADDLVLMTGALHALHERRISCPADLEVMSSDDAEWLDVFSPPISTVVQPAYELGEIAATLLMKRIKHLVASTSRSCCSLNCGSAASASEYSVFRQTGTSLIDILSGNCFCVEAR